MKLKIFFISAFIVLMSFVFVACFNVNDTGTPDRNDGGEQQAVPEFGFGLSEDGEYAVLTTVYANGAKEITVPSEYQGLPVKEIGDRAFGTCVAVVSVTLPEGTVGIGDYSFSGCISLQQIVLPDSLETIGSNAFFNCSALEKIELPQSLTSLGKEAFSECVLLESVDLPEGLESVGEYAFSYCKALEKAEISSTVKEIGKEAFIGCESLLEINVDKNNFFYKSVDGNLYDKEGKILYKYAEGKTAKEFSVPEGTEEIVSRALYGSKFESVVVPDSVNKIGKEAFRDCNSLKSITLPFVGEQRDAETNTAFHYIFGIDGSYNTYVPESLTDVVITGGKSVAARAFQFCDGIKRVTLADSITSIGDYAFIDGILEYIDMGNGVTSIGNGAFDSCENLENIVLSEKLLAIGDRVFYDCTSLTELTIPASVVTIGRDTVLGCDALDKVNFENVNGWRICLVNTFMSQVKSVSAATLSDPQSAMNFLKENTTMYWKRY